MKVYNPKHKNVFYTNTFKHCISLLKYNYLAFTVDSMLS